MKPDRRRKTAGDAEGAGAPCRIVVDDLGASRVEITGAEAEHLRKALRVRIGERVQATDGRGARATLEITGFRKQVVEASVIAKRQEPLPERRLWVATAAHGARFDWLVEKAVELGAFGLLSIESRDGERPRLGRWERVARAALGQSMGSWALALGSVAGAREAIEAGEPVGGPWESVLVADPDAGEAPGEGLEVSGAHLLLAGPPEGFAPRDREYLRADGGVGRICLGERRLRSETAALALLVWAQWHGSRASTETS